LKGRKKQNKVRILHKIEKKSKAVSKKTEMKKLQIDKKIKYVNKKDKEKENSN